MFNAEVKITVLKAINSHLASFKSGNELSGVVHTSDKGVFTVVLDGGNVLGTFESAFEAIEAVNVTADQIVAHKDIHGPYWQYKRSFHLFNMVSLMSSLSRSRGFNNGI